PLNFFEAAKHYHMDRTFWSSTQASFYLVGAGTICSLTADKNQNRFQEINSQWNSLLSQATVHNPYQVPGTGLMSIGGMRFDPQKKRTDLWEKFADGSFRIPRFTLVQTSQTTYLTINAYINVTEDAAKHADTLRQTAN